MAYATRIGHKPTVRRKNGGLTKLLFCSVLFFVAVLLKITDVPGISDTVLHWIEQGTVEDAMAALGMSMTDADLDVTEVFSSALQEVFALDAQEQETSGQVLQTSQVVPVIDTIPDIPTIELLEHPVFSSDGQVSIEDLTEETVPDPVFDTADPGSPALPDVVSAESVAIAFSYVTPVIGYITSDFGYRDHPIDGEYKFHYGVDIGASEGTPIRAFADGVVNTVLKGEINGNYFKVQHNDGIVSMYAHCQKIVVKPGQTVKKGDIIAYVGQTGQVSGPHLHFQIYKNGKIIDPTGFLEVLA